MIEEAVSAYDWDEPRPARIRCESPEEIIDRLQKEILKLDSGMEIVQKALRVAGSYSHSTRRALETVIGRMYLRRVDYEKQVADIIKEQEEGGAE